MDECEATTPITSTMAVTNGPICAAYQCRVVYGDAGEPGVKRIMIPNVRRVPDDMAVIGNSKCRRPRRTVRCCYYLPAADMAYPPKEKRGIDSPHRALTVLMGCRVDTSIAVLIHSLDPAKGTTMRASGETRRALRNGAQCRPGGISSQTLHANGA